jgi:hypothetical protein
MYAFIDINKAERIPVLLSNNSLPSKNTRGIDKMPKMIDVNLKDKLLPLYVEETVR